MTRDEEIKLIAECAVTDEKYNEFKEGIIWGAKWADENPKSGTVNKQEFIEKTISYFTPILKTYCSEECVKELIDGFVNSMEE